MTGARGKASGRRPRLVQLCAVDYTAFYLLRPLARALAADFDVTFISSHGPYVERLREEGFGYHVIPIERSYRLAAHALAFARLRRLFVRERYDVVHVHTPIAGLIGRFAARTARVPLTLYTAHGYYFHDGMSAARRRFFAGLERMAGRCTDFTFVQSAEDLESAVALGIAPRERIQHIGNGIDLRRFDPERLAGEREGVRRELGIDGDAAVVCIVGRVVREKGYPELARAFADLVRDIPGATLVVVGGRLENAHDDASAAVASIIAQNGLDSRVRFLSFRDDVERILAASDLFVLPSHREGMPRSLIEAMAMGLPVVATRIRGSREVVEDGVNGCMVPVNDGAALAGAMRDLLTNPRRSAAMGREAQLTVRKRFDETDFLKRQVDTIRRLGRSAGVLSG